MLSSSKLLGHLFSFYSKQKACIYIYIYIFVFFFLCYMYRLMYAYIHMLTHMYIIVTN